MKFLIFLGFLLMACSVCADTVLIRKSDGFPIEYQSGKVSLEILLENNPSYAKSEVELKEISVEEYEEIFNKKVVEPEQNKINKEKEKAKNKIKQKLILTDEDLEDLKAAIK